MFGFLSQFGFLTTLDTPAPSFITTGVDGPLLITNGQTVNIAEGSTKNYTSIQIDAGGTLNITGDSGLTTFIGCQGNCIINGQIIARMYNNGVSRSNVDPWLSSTVAYTINQKTGGSGGRSGVGLGAYASTFASGGTQANGLGGGGGAGAGGYNVPSGGSRLTISPFNGQPRPGIRQGAGGTGGNASNNGAGGSFNTEGLSGGSAGAGGQSSASSGLSPSINSGSGTIHGGNGGQGVGGGGGGGGADYVLYYDSGSNNYDIVLYGGGGGGGGGGAKGYHGKAIFFVLEGTISGTGTIFANGTNGTSGGGGGTGDARFYFTNFNFYDPSSGYTDANAFGAGGGGGGGGAGGSGGRVYINYKVNSPTFTINVSGGSAGSGGSNGAGRGSAIPTVSSIGEYTLGVNGFIAGVSGNAGSSGDSGSTTITAI